MTNLQEKTQFTKFSDNIKNLQHEVEKKPDDLIAKLTLATALQQEKHYDSAIELYEEIIEEDTEGIFASSAEKAIEEIKNQQRELGEEDDDELSIIIQKKKKNIWQILADLPIAYKQFIALFISSSISIFGVVLAGRLITIILGQEQLENQAVAELAISQINYDSRIDSLEAGFRGQTDNIAIIEVAKTYKETGEISPVLKDRVRQILKNEINNRQIEYATLIGLDKRVIVNANNDRTGQIFDPNNLVSEVLRFPRPLQTNIIIPWAEIQAEKPPLPSGVENQDVLMKVVFYPVIDNESGTIIALLMGGEIVNGKDILLRKTIEAVGSGYNAIYIFNQGKFELVSSLLQNRDEEPKTNVPLPDISLMERAERGERTGLVERYVIDNEKFTVAVQSLFDFDGKSIAFMVRGTSERQLETLLNESLQFQIIAGIIGLLIALGFGFIFGRNLTNPIKKLQQTAQRIGRGERNVIAEVTSNDEVGQLAQTFNEMAERMADYTQKIENTAKEREKEIQFQKRQREELQKNVINLLLDIEEASKGDLTVQAEVVSGEVGSIADAFNSTVNNLQQLVAQVVTSANQVHGTALATGQSVNQLALNSNQQDKSIREIGVSIEEIARENQKISESAQNAAFISTQSRLTAQEGEKIIDETVNSIYQIRQTVSDTAKKAKRLADSSQEISKIIQIISGISEKTNLLAFNASIEAARAGENGQGFRVVADEVRRLAEQVTFSTQEIEQLVLSIQDETTEMMKMMEESTTQVVTGTKLVKNTKETLQKLATISNDIDGLLDSISQSIVDQKLTSQKVNENMQQVAKVTTETAQEANAVSQSLQDLVKVAMEMQKSASRFQI